MTLVELTLFGIPLILISSAMLGFFTAYGVGANDVANAMGTSVGSKVLTVKQAVLVAAVFEFLGAFLAGGGVTQTIRKGVIDPTLFDGNLEIFIYGMISALFAAGTWLLISSLRGWPVSTTHTIVGAIVGFGIYALGFNSINWSVVGNIGLSWITSPLSSALVAGLFYYICKEFIIDKPSRYKGLIIRVYIFLAGFAIALITVTKGLKNIFKQQDLFVTFQDSVMISAIAALLFTFIFYYFSKAKLKNSANSEAQFAYLMIFTSCAVAFAHGSNDVANAIGPMSAIISVASEGAIGAKAAVSPWVLLIGGAGIVFGLAMLGGRVIKTVGTKITHLTPSLGFSAEMAAASTVVAASYLGFPISTTHTLVGGVIGVGLAKGAEHLDFSSIKRIIASWLVTIPAGAAFIVLFYVLLRIIFGV